MAKRLPRMPPTMAATLGDRDESLRASLDPSGLITDGLATGRAVEDVATVCGADRLDDALLAIGVELEIIGHVVEGKKSVVDEDAVVGVREWVVVVASEVMLEEVSSKGAAPSLSTERVVVADDQEVAVELTVSDESVAQLVTMTPETVVLL